MAIAVINEQEIDEVSGGCCFFLGGLLAGLFNGFHRPQGPSCQPKPPECNPQPPHC